MENKKKYYVFLCWILVSVVAMGVVDGVIQPDYWIKSMMKLLLFGILTAIGVVWIDGRKQIRDLFGGGKKAVAGSLLFGLAVYIFILVCYFTIGAYFDFSNIVPDLANRGNIHRGNFWAVGLYISFVNSFLEEFFFRGVGFLYLSRILPKGVCLVLSSLLFSLYHVGFMASWFSLPLFLLLIGALFAVGMLFCYMDDKGKGIAPSWIVHIFANLSINTVGFMLFGLLL